MPFKSKKQQKWMFINKPKLAKKWAKKYGGFKTIKSKGAQRGK